MRRLAAGIAAVLVGGLVLAAIGLRAVRDDPATWHADPLTAARDGAPNQYLVAPAGMAAAQPDRISQPRALPPVELMARLDAVALADGARRIAGAPEELWATYVQRTPVMGFPDYVSVRAVRVPDGSALAIWSRSRFGYSDFGVNRARVEQWLAAVEADQ